MSRFLITTQPIPGHINPVLPIARKLIERGHDVCWYTGTLFRTQVEATGVRYLPMKAARDLDLTDPTVMPERHKLTGVDQLKFYLKHLLLDAAPGQIEDLRMHLKDFPAAAILSDVTFLGSMFLAKMDGPPCAVLGATAYPKLSVDTAPYGLGMEPWDSPLGRLRNRLLNWLISRVVFRDVNRYATRVRADVGLPPTSFAFIDTGPLTADLYLQTTTGAFEYPRRDRPSNFRYIGPLIHTSSKPFEPPPWWGDVTAGERPVIHVTQGTIATDHRQLMVPTIQGLAEEDVIVVATTGGKTADEFPLKPLPPNVRLEPFIPYGELLPYADAVVTNAGYGGVQLTLAHGVPLVAAGQTEDKREISARINWAGVGITFKTDSPEPEQIREAVRKVLKTPQYRTNAERVQADFAQHDAPTEAAEALEALVR